MNKDNKNITTTTNQVVAGNSPLSAGLKASLASFSDARDTAFKNSQAESIVSTENSNTKNITKPSRNNASTTLIGLGRLKGFMGASKNKTA
jgi:hypothetical protein